MTADPSAVNAPGSKYTPIRTRFAEAAVANMRKHKLDAKAACEMCLWKKRLYNTYWDSLKPDERLAFVNLVQRMERADK